MTREQSHSSVFDSLISDQGDTSWKADANCKSVDTSIFFGKRTIVDDDPTSNRREPGRKARLAIARGYCESCIVRSECYEWALEHLPHGFAGGATERERQNESRRRRRDGV